MSRVASSADLVDLLEAADTHHVTASGRYGRVLATSGINPRIQGPGARERTSRRFAALAARLPVDTHLQVVFTNRP